MRSRRSWEQTKFSAKHTADPLVNVTLSIGLHFSHEYVLKTEGIIDGGSNVGKAKRLTSQRIIPKVSHKTVFEQGSFSLRFNLLARHNS
jgi:hypothetical protein